MFCKLGETSASFIKTKLKGKQYRCEIAIRRIRERSARSVPRIQGYGQDKRDLASGLISGSPDECVASFRPWKAHSPSAISGLIENIATRARERRRKLCAIENVVRELQSNSRDSNQLKEVT